MVHFRNDRLYSDHLDDDEFLSSLVAQIHRQDLMIFLTTAGSVLSPIKRSGGRSDNRWSLHIESSEHLIARRRLLTGNGNGESIVYVYRKTNFALVLVRTATGAHQWARAHGYGRTCNIQKKRPRTLRVVVEGVSFIFLWCGTMKTNLRT